MDEDEFEENEEMNSHKFRAIDAVVLTLGLVHELVSAVYQTTMTAYNLAAAHANYIVDQDNFRKEAALDIETITGEQDG